MKNPSYKTGACIEDLGQLEEYLKSNRNILLRDKPVSPDFIKNMTLATILAFMRVGELKETMYD